MSHPRSGGGWQAIKYALTIADRVGWLRLWRAMRSKNACKTCALGMGGQKGGMRNEAGHWPEVCKKSLQAMAADMQDGLRSEFFRRYGFAELQTLTPRELEAAGRIVQPLYAGPGDTHYRVVDWPFAMQRVVAALHSSTPQQSFFYASGRSSNEAAFLLQLFARLYGTNHVNNCSYYCHQASGAGLSASLGGGTATIGLDDIEHTDLLFLIGGNPASNHPRLMRTMLNIRRRGGKIVVVNPVREPGLVNFRVPSDWRSLLFGSEIASEYVQPHIGGDIALLTGIAKGVLARGAVDASFIQQATEGWPAFRDRVERTPWDEIERSSGVSRDQIERVADLYSRAKSAVFSWTMGITHHEHGTDNVRMIVNVALMRGMVGRPHAGVLPIRGHSNVQGIGSVGVTPRLKEAIFARLQGEFGLALPTTPGYDTMACMEAAHRGEMRVGLCLGGNLFGSNPDARFAAEALGRIQTLVYMNTTLNTGHAWGRAAETIVLPVLARDEEPQSTTQESMFNYVRLSDGGVPRHVGPRSEVSVLAEIARRVLDGAGEAPDADASAIARPSLSGYSPSRAPGPIDWREMERHSTIRRMIARVVPGFEKLSRIDASKEEFHIAGRVLHSPVFPTASGRAAFAAVAIPSCDRSSEHATRPDEGEADGGNGDAGAITLRLMTVRSEGQFNTVVFEDEDIYRGQDRRDVILMNADDMARAGLRADQLVSVRSATGEMQVVARPFAIRAGNAVMYYPEANVLVPRTVDAKSRTPAFKNVPVTIRPAKIAERREGGRIALAVAQGGGRRKYNAC